jgi:hypothetical protein
MAGGSPVRSSPAGGRPRPGLDRVVIWHIAGEEWEVVEVPADPRHELSTLMISTRDACGYEYPEAVVE